MLEWGQCRFVDRPFAAVNWQKYVQKDYSRLEETTVARLLQVLSNPYIHGSAVYAWVYMDMGINIHQTPLALCAQGSSTLQTTDWLHSQLDGQHDTDLSTVFERVGQTYCSPSREHNSWDVTWDWDSNGHMSFLQGRSNAKPRQPPSGRGMCGLLFLVLWGRAGLAHCISSGLQSHHYDPIKVQMLHSICRTLRSRPHPSSWTSH